MLCSLNLPKDRDSEKVDDENSGDDYRDPDGGAVPPVVPVVDLKTRSGKRGRATRELRPFESATKKATTLKLTQTTAAVMLLGVTMRYLKR